MRRAGDHPIPPFLDCDSAVARLMHAMDWSDSPLGTVENWPEYLRTTVAILLRTASPIVLLWGEEGVLIYNDAYAEFSGARHPEILGQPAAIAWPDAVPFNAHVLEVVLAGGKLSYEDQHMVLLRNGTPEDLWLKIDYSPVVDESGTPRGVLALLKNTTNRVETRHRLRIAQEAGGIGTFEWFPDTGRLEVSAEFRNLWNLPPDTPVNAEMLLAQLHPDDRPAAGVSRLNRSNPLSYVEYRRIDPVTGEQRWIARRGEVVQYGEDAPPRFVGVAFDVTDRKEAEQRLASSEARWRGLFEEMQEGFFVGEAVRDEDGRMVDFVLVELNPAFERQTGLDVQTATGRRAKELIPTLEQELVEAYGRVLDSGEPTQLEVHVPELDGRWFQARAHALDANRFAVLFVDISANKEAERAIAESEASFRMLAQSLPNHVWTADKNGEPEWFNDRVLAYTGVEQEALVAGEWLDIVHPDDRVMVAAAWDAARELHVTYDCEFRIRRRDGEYRWHIARAVPVYSTNGKIERWIGSNTDIDDKKQAETVMAEQAHTLEDRVAQRTSELLKTQDALRQAQKMEALGNLTGGIAHDFNNLLQVISGNLQLLEREADSDERIAVRVRNAMAGVTRGARLASQLLAFGRRQPLAPKVVNLGRLIRDTDDMLRRTLGEAIEVETVIGGGLWNTEIDPGNVENALLNLAINARDAMDGQGRLTIEAGNASLDCDYAMAQGDVIPGQYVMLAVSDTGCGMTPEVVEKVFEPFFTTKPEGHGSGLGLSMVYGFVKQSGGHVKVYSEPGHGTTIKLYLPRCTREEEALDDPGQPGPVVGGSETILVVEDDDAVRETVIATLRDLGYRVLKARHAASALAIIEGGTRIDLLFTDVVMPGPMRSIELVREARKQIPGLPVLFTSGYTQNSIVHGGRLDEGVELLSKPYAREVLARRLRQLLAGPGSTLPARAPRPVPMRRPVMKDPRPIRILVCEDDWMIRSLVIDMLQSRGHDVVEASDAAEAIAAHANRPVEVLITDVGLPDLSGAELAGRLRAVSPGLPVIFATGEKHVDGVTLDQRTHVLTKPFGSDQLRDTLAALIAQPVGGS